MNSTILTVKNQIKESLVDVEQRLQDVVLSDIEVLKNAAQHIISSGGKRLRPQISLLCYLAAGGTDLPEIISAAAAVELVHTATLVHDDINDHSLTRRGKVTVHAQWGRTFALLVGDYLFSKVYEMMAPYGSRVNHLMSSACVRLVEGETLQAVAAKSGDINRETYKMVIERKTASLFEASAEISAIVAGADDETTRNLHAFARNLGMAFQVVDDILDIIGDPEALGKPVGLDVAQGRGVMVAEAAAGSENGKNGHKEDPLAAMMAKLRDSGAVEIAKLQAQELANRARTALMKVSPSPARDELDSLIDKVLDRQN